MLFLIHWATYCEQPNKHLSEKERILRKTKSLDSEIKSKVFQKYFLELRLKNNDRYVDGTWNAMTLGGAAHQT